MEIEAPLEEKDDNYGHSREIQTVAEIEGGYEVLGVSTTSSATSVKAKTLRFLAAASAGLLLMCTAGWIMHSPAESQRAAIPERPKDVVRLYQRRSNLPKCDTYVPYETPGCTDPEAVCFCPQDKELCTQFRFEVGDILIFGHGPSNTPELALENGLMQLVAHGAVHASIITAKTGAFGLDGYIITEALKPMAGSAESGVVESTLCELLDHRQYHDVWVRRVDKARYPQFFAKLPAMASFAKQQLGEPFDNNMLFPGIRISDPNWFPQNPNCLDRQRAIDKYKAGGPDKYMCSQLVAWTVAYGGGLNTDYGAQAGSDGGLSGGGYSGGGGASGQGCENDVPGWVVPHLQPSPGDLLEQPYYDASRYHVLCKGGCGAGFVNFR